MRRGHRVSSQKSAIKGVRSSGQRCLIKKFLADSSRYFVFSFSPHSKTVRPRNKILDFIRETNNFVRNF